MWTITAFIITGCALFFSYHYLVRGVKNKRNNNKPHRKQPINKIKDNFNLSKLDDSYDAIVVGSGPGGLSTACILGNCGWKVLVLEQHDVAGGCTHNFVDDGIEFDTGIHYVGNVDKLNEQLMWMTNQQIEWCPIQIENDAYDKIILNDKMFSLCAGQQNCINELAKHFPEKRKALDTYFNIVKKVAKQETFFRMKTLHPAMLRKCAWFVHMIFCFFFNTDGWNYFYKFQNVSARQVVKKLINDPILEAILLGQFGDYGVLPNEASFIVHCHVVNHYLNGAYYPKGGSHKIAEAFANKIDSNGGQILVNAPVRDIVVVDNQVYGVIVKNQFIESRVVVSDAGIYNTFYQLIKQPTIERRWVSKTDRSISCFYMFLGFDGNVNELGLPSTNYWFHHDENIEENMSKFYENPQDNFHLGSYFVSFPCAKDESWSTRFPRKSNAIVIFMVPYNSVKEWENSTQKSRSNEYKNFKRDFADKMYDCFVTKFPHLDKYVVYRNVSSPLTFNHYINSTQGEIYGASHSIKNDRYSLDKFIPETSVKGLFLTGQDIVTCGLAGSIGGGIISAHRILGYGEWIDIFTGRSLMTDI